MAQLFGALLLIGLAVFAIKIAFVFLILAGLIFRTKETIGLLIVLGAWALFKAHPVAGIGLFAIAGIYAIVRAAKSDSATTEEVSDPPPEVG